METGLAVADAMTRRPIRVPKNLTVQECARIMRDKDVGSVLIAEEDGLLGILTHEDIIEKVVAAAADAEKVAVGDIMTTDLITITPKRDIIHAITLMKDNDIRHLPVVEDGRLVGFLTIKDVLKVEPQLFELLLDTMDLREEERKVALRASDYTTEGFCESCVNFSEELARSGDRRLICPDCRE